MADIPEIPAMVAPSPESTLAFLGIIAFICTSAVIGVWRGGTSEETDSVRNRWGILAGLAMLAWLLMGAAVPLSHILETRILPPPTLFYVVICFLAAAGLTASPFGYRLANWPLAALIGFHAFRLPLELILHQWFRAGTLPVQMTYEGHNFDIVTGLLAISIGLWSLFGQVPRAVIWGFNLVGTSLLAVVIGIAITSSPVPFRRYMNDPPVLLVFNFPYSWIVPIAVTGALMGHLVLFRKLFSGRNATH